MNFYSSYGRRLGYAEPRLALQLVENMIQDLTNDHDLWGNAKDPVDEASQSVYSLAVLSLRHGNHSCVIDERFKQNGLAWEKVHVRESAQM